jgi:hypothetical protein
MTPMGTQLGVSIIGITDETAVRKSMTSDALSAIKYYTSDTEYTTYENYVIVDNYRVKKNSSGTYDMMFYLVKDDNNPRVTAINIVYPITSLAGLKYCLLSLLEISSSCILTDGSSGVNL